MITTVACNKLSAAYRASADKKVPRNLEKNNPVIAFTLRPMLDSNLSTISISTICISYVLKYAEYLDLYF